VQGRQFEAERNYARSRYDYLLVLLELQQAAGSLDREDVWQINQWLNPSNMRSTAATYAP
jgi:outer membrane protein